MRKASSALIITALLALSVAGCFLSPKQKTTSLDGSGGLATTEASDMGTTVGDGLFGNSSLQKTSATDILTIVWAWDSTDGCWTRSATGTNSNGYTGSRIDTVWLYDSSNGSVKKPSILTVTHYTHKRYLDVTGIHGHTYVGSYTMNVTIAKNAADTVFTFNGTSAGTFDGTSDRSATFTDVLRNLQRTPTFLTKPYSGSLYLDNVKRTINATYTDTNVVSGTYTDKNSGVTKNFTIDLTTGTETITN